MIIHSVKANNVLKYKTLELNDLPKEGVIAISGFNESGKSTIGETICFALFGRTFSINDDELGKIIRWGESDCSVTICFSNDKNGTPDSELYAISRMLDCDGNHSAKLYQVYNEDNPLARGIEGVERALFELTSIEYEEFIESFYLAQREITTPHPHSYALKTMAGIATMEHCDNGIHEDIEQDQEASDELRKRISQLEEDVEALEIDDQHLEAVTTQHDQALQDKAKTDASLANYQTGIEEYQDTAPRLNRYLSKKGRGSFWRSLSFILAAVSLALWWILVKMPDAAIYTQVSDFLHSNLSWFEAQHYLYLGVAFGVLFLALWAAIISHKGNVTRLGKSGSDLAEKMHSLDAERAVEADEARIMLIKRVAKTLSDEQELVAGTEPDLNFLTQQQNTQSEQISRLSSELVIEQDRVNRATELQEKMTGLHGQIAEKESRNQVRELASELLMRATRHLSKRFNHIVRDHVGKTLPLFTENRYEHLQIDDDLTVRVFSNEKHDFMELDEISSGTQRQIMLAVRLALSQEMVSRKVHSRQFLILDEPFAFFDAERTEKSLAVLPQLSHDLTQFWIIAQTFPEQMNFELSINCERDIVAKIN
ncbi:MAG: AAA family ATPase [Gammaproteobacteria bacterium]|nr:AAA family ATPase [Gammaproteobacteria bacterium]